MADDYLAYGGQIVYRPLVKKKSKLGAGVLYGANSNYLASPEFRNTLGYGAVFADALRLLGQRQKWSFGAQIGHGIYNHDYRYYKIKAGIYYSISASYRAIVSKKLLFNTSLFFGHRNFHDTDGYSEDNSSLAGLRLGVVF